MAQYDLWPGFEKLAGYNGIYVTEGDVAMMPQAAAAFTSCQKHYVVIDDGSIRVKDFSVFACRGFKGMKPTPPSGY